MIRDKLKTIFGEYPVNFNDGYSNYSILESNSGELRFEDNSLTFKQRIPALILGLIIITVLSLQITLSDLYYLIPILPVFLWFTWRFKPKEIVFDNTKMEVRLKSILGFNKAITYLNEEIDSIVSTPIEYSLSGTYYASITINLKSGKKRNLLSINSASKEASVKLSNDLASIFNSILR